MKTHIKIGLVIAGYAAALVAGCALPFAHELLLPDDPVHASPGMDAFGDLLGGVGVFGVLSLVPTGLALCFLRPYKKFWTALSVVSLVLAIGFPVAIRMMLAQQPQSPIAEMLAFVQVAGAPLLVLTFLVCAVIAPTWPPRQALLATAMIEIAVCAYAFICMFVLRRWI